MSFETKNAISQSTWTDIFYTTIDWKQFPTPIWKLFSLIGRWGQAFKRSCRAWQGRKWIFLKLNCKCHVPLRVPTPIKSLTSIHLTFPKCYYCTLRLGCRYLSGSKQLASVFCWAALLNLLSCGEKEWAAAPSKGHSVIYAALSAAWTQDTHTHTHKES